MSTPRASGSLRLDVVRGIGDLSAEWDDLTAAAGHRTPFLRSWWLDGVVMWRPRVLVVTDRSGALVGGLAMEYRHLPFPELRLIGDQLGAADLDLLAHPGARDDVVAAVGAWFRRYRRPLRLRFAGLAAGSLVSSLVPGGHERLEGRAYHEPLPATLDTYLHERSRSFRKSVYQARRAILERSGMLHRWYDASETDVALEAFGRLHRRRFGAASTLARALPQVDVAVRRGVERGEAHLHGIELDGSPVAVDVLFDVGGRLALYARGAALEDPRVSGVGRVLLAAAIEWACQHGRRDFDLLRGDEPYKQRWTTEVREVHAVTGHNGHVARRVEQWRPAARRLMRRARGAA